MAGFAVFMTLVTFAFVGLVAACLLAVILYAIAKGRVKRGASSRSATVVGVLAPFAGLLWIAVAFLFHIQISNTLAHQDCGLSGDPYVTLPNGYVLGSHNTYDGYIRAPGYETDVPVEGPGYVRSIIDLEFADPYFIGTQFDFNTSRVRSFVFDTRTREFHASEPDSQGNHTFDPSDKAALDAWTDANNHAQGDQESYWTLYRRYRHRWPKYVSFVVIAGGEIVIMFWVRKVWMTPAAERMTETP
jgi:hypothetical protein